jgi:hypothetical protein
MFRELFARWPGIESAGEPEMIVSNQLHGIRRLPYRTS